jgi:hypothetical protein
MIIFAVGKYSTMKERHAILSIIGNTLTFETSSTSCYILKISYYLYFSIKYCKLRRYRIFCRQSSASILMGNFRLSMGNWNCFGESNCIFGELNE